MAHGHTYSSSFSRPPPHSAVQLDGKFDSAYIVLCPKTKTLSTHGISYILRPHMPHYLSLSCCSSVVILVFIAPL